MIISYGRQNIDNSDIKFVAKSLKSKLITQGPLVRKFENSLKKKLKCKYATVVNNGSSALLLVGKILNWKKGDLIAVPPITFLSSVNVIEHCNAKPIFIDINMNDYCMDPDKLELELKRDSKKKIKAAIITDYGGQPAQWLKFYYLKRKYNIILINDNCHALGSSIKNDVGYASKYADFVTLSFHPVKAITTGEGGAIITKKINFDKKAKILRSHGIIRDEKKYWSYKMENLGFNFRLPDINCALGISQLKKLNKFVLRRKKIANIYNNFFFEKKKFQIPKKIEGNQNSYHLYPLLVNFKKIKKKKDKLINEFLSYKIKLQVHYIPVNSQPYYKKKYGLNKTKFKNSFELYRNQISIPIYYGLSSSQIKYFLKICRRLFKMK